MTSLMKVKGEVQWPGLGLIIGFFKGYGVHRITVRFHIRL